MLLNTAALEDSRCEVENQAEDQSKDCMCVAIGEVHDQGSESEKLVLDQHALLQLERRLHHATING